MLATDKSAGDLLSISSDELKDYIKQVDYFSVGDIIRLMKIGADMNNDLKFSGLDERLILEMNAVKMAEIEATVKFEEVLAYLKGNPTPTNFSIPEKKKSFNPAPKVTFVNKSEEVAPPKIETPVVKESTPEPVKEYTEKLNLLKLQAGWKKFLSSFNKKRPMLASQLGLVQITDVSENNIVFTYPGSCENSKLIVEKKENFDIITASISEYFEAKIRISFELDENIPLDEQDEIEQNDSKIKLQEIVGNSDRIKNLLEKVDGKVVGIKKVT